MEQGVSVRNQLTMHIVTLRIIPTWITLPITFHEPCYMNRIQMFGNGTRPRKALSYQMNQTYTNLMRDTGEGLGASYPGFLEISNEISTLGQVLTREQPTGTMPDDIDHC